MDRTLQRQNSSFPHVLPKNSRKRAPQTRMRMLILGQTVRADHGFGGTNNSRHIGFVHQKVDGASGLQLRYGIGGCAPELERYVVQIPGTEFRVWIAPG